MIVRFWNWLVNSHQHEWELTNTVRLVQHPRKGYWLEGEGSLGDTWYPPITEERTTGFRYHYHCKTCPKAKIVTKNT